MDFVFRRWFNVEIRKQIVSDVYRDHTSGERKKKRRKKKGKFIKIRGRQRRKRGLVFGGGEWLTCGWWWWWWWGGGIKCSLPVAYCGLFDIYPRALRARVTRFGSSGPLGKKNPFSKSDIKLTGLAF